MNASNAALRADPQSAGFLYLMDEGAILRHLAYLNAEPCAVSLNAELPSGRLVTIHKGGKVTPQVVA